MAVTNGAVSVPKRKRMFSATINAGKISRLRTRNTSVKSGTAIRIYRRTNGTSCAAATMTCVNSGLTINDRILSALRRILFVLKF